MKMDATKFQFYLLLSLTTLYIFITASASQAPQLRTHWVPSSAQLQIPPNAVEGGYEHNNVKVYIARAFHEGDLLPGKFIPNRRVAYVSYKGKEHIKTEYIEVLNSTSVSWVPSSNGNVPYNAVMGGYTTEGEPLYVGRAVHDGLLIPGKIHPSRETLYIPYDGKELKFREYEVLIEN
uniref:Uncharacterized protein n=1 Tax=Phlebotomus papatasi TaxID=29031 RepID=A0A1B0D3A9_PHLPP